MKGLIAFIFAMLALPSAAHAEEQWTQAVGPWQVAGSAGDCMAHVRIGEKAVAVLSPASDGTNFGGFMVLAPGQWTPKASDRARLAFEASGGWAFEKKGRGDADLNGYWAPFDTATEVDAFPDRWRLKATLGDAALLEFEAISFQAVVKALRTCVSDTRKPS